MTAVKVHSKSILKPPPATWALLVIQLDPLAFDYRPPDIAFLMKINVELVRHHARILWPEWKGQYVMDIDQAAVLIYRACRGARNIPSREEMFDQLQAAGVVGPDFPDGDARIERALKAILRHREESRVQ